MTRIVISLVVLVAILVSVAWLIRHKKNTKRGAVVTELRGAGFVVECEGFANKPGFSRDISVVSGAIRGYEFAAEVNGTYVRDAAADYGHYYPVITISASLHCVVPAFSMRRRLFIHGQDWRKVSFGATGIDEGALALGSASFDDRFLLYCEHIDSARRWFDESFIRLFSGSSRSRQFLRVHDELWVPQGGTELNLKLHNVQAEKADLLNALDYVVFIAELLYSSASRRRDGDVGSMA